MTEGFIKSGTLVNKKFREFFIPTVLASMAAQLGTIINGIIVGNLISPHAMAAISACLPLNQITYALAVLISMGSSGLIAIAAGKRDNDGANFIFRCAENSNNAKCAGRIFVHNKFSFLVYFTDKFAVSFRLYLCGEK